MARRLVISDGSNAQEASAYKIAVGGLVKPVLIGMCSENGIVRQFWPPAASSEDPVITWTDSALTVNESVADPADSIASITFTRSLGSYSYKNYPGADGGGTFLNPPLDGTGGDDGKYLIRVDQTGGDALTGTLATWIDINSLASHVWSLDETVVGASSATANISISQDDGGGNPVAATTVVKVVTFNSEVRTASSIVWNTIQRDLVEIKQAEDATCILTFNPDGFATGDADTSGSFNEAWHILSPNVPDPQNYTVTVALISGTAPTGSALATPLTLDAVRQWTLLATSGEDLSCALDVEVDTIPTSVPVVKRVTMNSQRSLSILPVWTTAQWIITDANTPTDATITLGIDGIGRGFLRTFEQETEDWHVDAPTPSDLNNYECRLYLVADGGDVTGSATETWLRLTSEVSWNFALGSDFTTWVVEVGVRWIGQEEIRKRVVINFGVPL
jgi:hypothetical protein